MFLESWLTLLCEWRGRGGSGREVCRRIPQDVRAFGAQLGPLCVPLRKSLATPVCRNKLFFFVLEIHLVNADLPAETLESNSKQTLIIREKVYHVYFN